MYLVCYLGLGAKAAAFDVDNVVQGSTSGCWHGNHCQLSGFAGHVDLHLQPYVFINMPEAGDKAIFKILPVITMGIRRVSGRMRVEILNRNGGRAY